MATIVLVHGSWFDSRCWHKVTPLLEAAGHSVLTPDLPGHGQDTTPITAISLASYAERIGDILATEPEPVVLVGHSMAGTVLSEVVERWPEKVAQSIYVAAFLLANGQSLFDVGGKDSASSLGPNLVPKPEQGVIGVKAEALAAVFFNDCSPADVEQAVASVQDEPLAPPTTPISTTTANFGRVPRAYISTLQDRVISPTAQQAMLAATPCDPVLTIDAGHCPFISQPETLARQILSLLK